jgi:hypothetical protein
MTESSITRLREIAAGCPPIEFRPTGLFVAHCGVLTLVFDGFAACVLALKDEIDRSFTDLEVEHEGSMWPKVSLAVLRDAQRLSEEDVRRLRDVADRWHEPIRTEAPDVRIDRLLAVDYGCRSLEVRRRSEELPLLGDTLPEEAPPHHVRFVRSVLSQFSRERLAEYTVSIDREGNRESHYREPATGWSLVADVKPAQLPLAGAILEDVEREVPGKYATFEPSSWHVTIRSLDRAPQARGPLPDGAQEE